MYLGVTLVTGWLTARNLELLVNKIQNKVAVLNVPKVLLSKLNSILSTFFWGEYNGKLKHKWVSWSTICKPTNEGGLGLRDFNEMQSSMHKKLVWRLLTLDNLWTQFFRAKYAKEGGLVMAASRANGSQFWKALMQVFPAVYDHTKALVKDFWVGNAWDENALIEMIGENRALEVVHSVKAGKEGSDVYIWEPTQNGIFTTASTWDIIRTRGSVLWVSLLPRDVIVVSMVALRLWIMCYALGKLLRQSGNELHLH
ncbi:hypothetical protein F2P56_012062 [Juglans regia]|uniref:Uncharacterized protein LOC108981286 n=2 Tax=Juglans regia TaxID=51240 RepID=A0A2I4DLA5_JUGRE|nr:uncharacterized protein LOC108981286 [Juglans regia]KAF5467850.1 hypothetical protein F2P56_012062 [Juglans regia]